MYNVCSWLSILILIGRIPTTDDLPRLHFTRMVLVETMRLYPPGWLLMRRAIQDDEIGGYGIPSHSSLVDVGHYIRTALNYERTGSRYQGKVIP